MAFLLIMTLLGFGHVKIWTILYKSTRLIKKGLYMFALRGITKSYVTKWILTCVLLLWLSMLFSIIVRLLIFLNIKKLAADWNDDCYETNVIDKLFLTYFFKSCMCLCGEQHFFTFVTIISYHCLWYGINIFCFDITIDLLAFGGG